MSIGVYYYGTIDPMKESNDVWPLPCPVRALTAMWTPCAFPRR